MHHDADRRAAATPATICSTTSAGDFTTRNTTGASSRIAARDALDPDELAHQLEAARESRLAARVLHRVRDLVRRDRDRRDRAPVMMLRQQPHRARLGIVVVAVVGLLDRHGLQVRLVEQMARKLRAGARQVGPVRAVLAAARGRIQSCGPKISASSSRPAMRKEMIGMVQPGYAIADVHQFCSLMLACSTILPNFSASRPRRRGTAARSSGAARCPAPPASRRSLCRASSH